MAHYTAVNDRFDKAPARRTLCGEKTKQREATTHIIEFPGGAVEVSRLDDGSYWAHIIVNQGQALPHLSDGLGGAIGDVVDSRIDWSERRATAIPQLPEEGSLTQIAIRIVPRRAGEPAASLAKPPADAPAAPAGAPNSDAAAVAPAAASIARPIGPLRSGQSTTLDDGA